MHSLLGFESTLIAVAALLILSILTSKAIGRLGIPSLLVFLAVGMLAGSEGIGNIEFDNVFYAQTVGVIALAYILFAGGLSTSIKSIRPVLWQGTLLGTVGVIVTCGLTGCFAVYALNLRWLEGLLLGAIVSSTDAAAVFAVLRTRAVGLKGNIQHLLELESGANDPMAVMLTVGFISLLTHRVESPVQLIPGIFQQILVGGTIGFGAGKAMSLFLNRIKLESEGLYPVMTLALVIFVYGVTQVAGGSGFLAVYLSGIVLGNESFIRKNSVILFHDGIAWLMQIAMFLTLGLLVYPSKLIPVAGIGLWVSAFLILVARPAAVFISLIGSKFSTAQKMMVAWVGLRGSVPIILATYPLLERVEHADLLFNLVFFIVITSILVQGGSIPLVARLLRVHEAQKTKPVRFKHTIQTGSIKRDLHEIPVGPDSRAIGKSILELALPEDALVVLIQRGEITVTPKGGTHLEKGDVLLILVESVSLGAVRAILA